MALGSGLCLALAVLLPQCRRQSSIHQEHSPTQYSHVHSVSHVTVKYAHGYPISDLKCTNIGPSAKNHIIAWQFYFAPRALPLSGQAEEGNPRNNQTLSTNSGNSSPWDGFYSSLSRRQGIHGRANHIMNLVAEVWRINSITKESLHDAEPWIV